VALRCASTVNPWQSSLAAALPLPPAPPSVSDLYFHGELLNCPRFPGEGDLAWLERLRSRWHEIRSLLE
jgi:hypothetical protein